MLEANKTSSKILLVEDDPILAESLKLNLELEGFSLNWAQDLNSAHRLFEHQHPDLIILDLGLPDGHGLELCKKLRAQNQLIPIIILTAEIDEDAVVNGLNAGANDYVKKPYSGKEFLARIHVLLRATHRNTPASESQLRFGPMALYLDKRQAYLKDIEIKLNRREFDILKYFMERPEIVVTREMLLNHLQDSEEIVDRTVDSHISHIRAKIKKAQALALTNGINIPNVNIRSEYGVGYRLVTHD